ncbi:hypothetical protein N9Y48_01815 [Zobellia sp.]|nr:hypothetical protein [Zobellia sp.]
MKRIYYFTLVISALFALQSCDQDLPENESITFASEGGLVNVTSQAIGYVVGNDASYTASVNVQQGDVKTTGIDVYKTFTSTTNGTSNTELFTSLDVPVQEAGATVPLSFSFTYADLINGLSIDGAPLSDNDAELNIGDAWTLTYESTTSEGDIVETATQTKVSVGTRFAGSYRTVDALYYRIGVLTSETGDWPDEILIESVDATTYRVVEYFGNFDGNEWYFQIDENDVISYPDETPDGDAQLGNGQPLITCASSPNNMTNVPCGSDVTNFVERDDVTGADKLYMSFGYLTAGSGPREFYQVLEKIVD